MRPRGKEREVVGKNLEEERAKGGALENTDRIGQRIGKESVSSPVSCTNRLSMATEVRRKPGRIDRIGLKFG